MTMHIRMHTNVATYICILFVVNLIQCSYPISKTSNIILNYVANNII